MRNLRTGNKRRKNRHYRKPIVMVGYNDELGTTTVENGFIKPHVNKTMQQIMGMTLRQIEQKMQEEAASFE